MGEYTSVSTFYGQEYVERVVSTGDYEVKSFTPAIYTFDLNPSTGNPINIELVSSGSKLTVFAKQTSISGWPYNGPQRISFLARAQSGVQGLSIKYNYTSTLYPNGDEFFTIGSTPNTNLSQFLGTWYSRDLGCWYDPRSDKLFLLYYAYGSDIGIPTSYFYTAQQITNETAKSIILDLFYDVTPENVKLERVSPASAEFAAGQTSELIYELKSQVSTITDATIQIVPGDTVGLSNGWFFDSSVSPPTLSLTSSRYRQSIKVSCEYQGITYTLTDVFYPAGYTPYGGGGNSGSGGGGGSFDPGPQDPVANDIPVGSTDATPSGLFTRYLMSKERLDIFGDWLWSTSYGVVAFKTLMSFFYGSVTECIIDCMSYPFDISSIGTGVTTGTIFMGSWDTKLNTIILTKNSMTINWGSVNISEYWGNFLDYSPHTQIDLYLPWGTGFVSIDPNDVMGASISVRTNVELDKGSCTHHVIGPNGRVLGTYNGVCGKTLPITSLDTSKPLYAVTTAVGVIGAATSALSAIGDKENWTKPITYQNYSGAGMRPVITQEPGDIKWKNISESVNKSLGAKLALGSAAALAIKPAQVQRSGSFASSGAGLSVQYPFVIVSRPEQNVPSQYGHHYGYPSNIYSNLFDISGYTEIASIHFNNLPALEAEKEEIESLLKGGVIF